MYRSRFFRLAVFAPLIALLFWPSTAYAQTFTSTFDSLDGWTVEQNGGNGVLANGALRFSYGTGLVSKTFLIENPSTVELSINVTNNETNSVGWSAQIADTYTVSIGNQSITSSEIHGLRTVSLSTETNEPNSFVTVSLSGVDNGFWAGWYGPIMDDLVLTVTPKVAPNSVWLEINEGWSGQISAPEGSVFTSVLFASYGNPSGSNGNYTLGWCHAQNSVDIIEDLLVGQNSAILDASNGVFGDPCGGTYKRLYVLASYSPVETTTTTTLPIVTTTTTSTILETTTTSTTEVPIGTTTTTSAPQTTVLQQTEQPQTTTTTSTSTVPLTTTTTTIPITPEITKEEAVAVATNADVVKNLSAEEATQVFEALDVEELTPEQAEQLVAAVQDAPQEVREAFEEEVNVFSGAVDTYVPVGSSIPISARRVIIGISAVVIFSAPPASRRN